MGKSTLLYTITDKKGQVVIANARAEVAANAIGTSRSYLQTCGNRKTLCLKKYIVTIKEKDPNKEKDLNSDYLIRKTLREWDQVMYGIRVRYRLDMSHWNEFMERKAVQA